LGSKELSIVNSVKDVVGLERLINCQRCVVAHEARMRGYDVVARPSWGFDDPMLKSSSWLSSFEYSPSDMKKCNGQTSEEMISNIKEIMKSFGEGSRSVIMFQWENRTSGSGHAIVSVCFKDGVVSFGDPQNKSRAAAKHLKSANLKSVVLLRIDNLNFTDMVKRCCMNRGD